MKYPLLSLTLISCFIIGCDANQPASTNTVNTKTETTAPAADKTELQSTVIETTQPKSEAPTTSTTAPAVQAIEKITLSGEQVYKKSCANCHGTGVAGAPKMGDAAAWSIRTAKGIEALYNSAKVGVPGTAMMAKGTCSVCSETELNAAVDYMVAESK